MFAEKLFVSVNACMCLPFYMSVHVCCCVHWLCALFFICLVDMLINNWSCAVLHTSPSCFAELCFVFGIVLRYLVFFCSVGKELTRCEEQIAYTCKHNFGNIARGATFWLNKIMGMNGHNHLNRVMGLGDCINVCELSSIFIDPWHIVCKCVCTKFEHTKPNFWCRYIKHV